MAWFEFSQNNSGGHFDIDRSNGIGPRVWIEAADADAANERALDIGLYFNGVEAGFDCDCCGDRWYEVWDSDGVAEPEIDDDYDFNWHNAVYLHPLEGPFKVVI
jgi:hypothetical protein